VSSSEIDAALRQLVVNSSRYSDQVNSERGQLVVEEETEKHVRDAGIGTLAYRTRESTPSVNSVSDIESSTRRMGRPPTAIRVKSPGPDISRRLV